MYEKMDFDVELAMHENLGNYEETAVPGAPVSWVPPSDPDGW